MVTERVGLSDGSGRPVRDPVVRRKRDCRASVSQVSSTPSTVRSDRRGHRERRELDADRSRGHEEVALRDSSSVRSWVSSSPRRLSGTLRSASATSPPGQLRRVGDRHHEERIAAALTVNGRAIASVQNDASRRWRYAVTSPRAEELEVDRRSAGDRSMRAACAASKRPFGARTASPGRYVTTITSGSRRAILQQGRDEIDRRRVRVVQVLENDRERKLRGDSASKRSPGATARSRRLGAAPSPDPGRDRRQQSQGICWRTSGTCARMAASTTGPPVDSSPALRGRRGPTR